MTTLLLVRHGESEANSGGFFAGQMDVNLQSKGIEQATKTGEYIAKEYSVDVVYASDLKRAYHTGEIIADISGADIVADKDLREIYAGKWQGKRFDDLVTDYNYDYSCWLNDIGNCKCTCGESVQQLSRRVLNALTQIAESNQGKTVVIATHATPIRAMQCLLSGYSLDDMKNIPWVSNASVTEITYDKEEWKIISVSKDEHLSELKTTFPANV